MEDNCNCWDATAAAAAYRSQDPRLQGIWQGLKALRQLRFAPARHGTETIGSQEQVQLS